MFKSAVKFLLIISFFVSGSFVFANGQELILPSDKIKKLDRKGTVFVSKILDNGRIAFVSEQEGEESSILISDMKGYLIRKFKLPVSKIDYIVISDDGKQAIIYTHKDYEFFYADLKRGKTKSIFKMEKGKTGFALFDKSGSWLDFQPNGIIARGFYYNGEGLFTSDNIVFINPEKTGIAVFQPVVETDRLMEGAKYFYPSAKEITKTEYTGGKLVYCAQDKHGGVILCYDTKTENLSKIDSFTSMLGMTVSDSGNLLTYIIRKQHGDNLPADMILYDLKEKAPKRVWNGRFYLPRLNSTGEYLAAGYLIPASENRFINRIRIYKTDKMENDGEESEILPTFKPVDWKFVRDSKDLFIFSGEDIYRFKLNR
ncbi:MAG: hypothetical protein LWY06_16990 [Firmicutes bacterium]|nr:hypothetical protein [Bacillota bacterium]